MKKVFVLLLLFAFMLSGCTFAGRQTAPQPAKPGDGQSRPKPEQPTPEAPKQGKKEYYLGLEAPVKGIKDWAHRYRRYDGVFMQKLGDYRAVLAGMGEKFSGGYKVKIDRVTKKEAKWVVEVSFEKPMVEDFSGTSTFPYEVVSIIDDGRPVEILAATGQKGSIPPKTPVKVIIIPEGKQLPASKSFVVFTPLEGEKIASPVLIKGKARVFEATFRIIIEDGHNRLADKTVMSEEGAPGWGNFEVKLPYEQATNPNGAIILAYENMKNGEMIEELTVPVKFE